MCGFIPITDMCAREIPNPEGYALEIEVLAGDSHVGRTSVPIPGTSKEDAGVVSDAAESINTRIAPELIGKNVFDQAGIERSLRKLAVILDRDKTGVDLIRVIAMAVSRAAALIR